MLDQFITDVYGLPWLRNFARLGPSQLLDKLRFRSETGLPPERVRCLWGTTLLEQVRHRVGYTRMTTFEQLDPRFSGAAARRAARTQSNLLLYSPYAWEAFTAQYPHKPRKILFQYHPHSDFEQRLLDADSARYPIIGSPPTVALSDRERDCWKHADLILCASTFTKHSLLEVGADEAKCRVIPYGIDVPSVVEVAAPSKFKAVFVGTGTQRKGLHHLLMAWQQADLPEDSQLTLVCRRVDEAMLPFLHGVPGVELLRGVGHDELNKLYATSALFAMPSLVEGFGQVYLEALAHGCPVLGTEYTCLPDIGNEHDGIFLVEASNVALLTAKLELLSRSLPGNREIRIASQSCASRFPWQVFRESIRRALL